MMFVYTTYDVQKNTLKLKIIAKLYVTRYGEGRVTVAMTEYDIGVGGAKKIQK